MDVEPERGCCSIPDALEDEPSRQIKCGRYSIVIRGEWQWQQRGSGDRRHGVSIKSNERILWSGRWPGPS